MDQNNINNVKEDIKTLVKNKMCAGNKNKQTEKKKQHCDTNKA